MRDEWLNETRIERHHLKFLSVQNLHFRSALEKSEGTPRGPMGLCALSFQQWFGLALQGSVSHDCKNGLLWRQPKLLWNVVKYSHSSVSLEKFIRKPPITNVSAFLHISQQGTARASFLPLCLSPCCFCNWGGIECCPKYQTSHMAALPRPCCRDAWPCYLRSLESGRTRCTPSPTYICWHICCTLSLYELINFVGITYVRA